MIESRSDKITQATVNHLDKTLPSPFYVNDFSTEQYLELLKHLFNLFDESVILGHTLAVEKGFKLFFQKSGQEIDIKLNAYSIKMSKVFKKNGIGPAMDKALFTLTQRLDLLTTNIKAYEVYSYLHQFPEEKSRELFESFSDVEVTNDDIRMHIREEVETLLKLHTRDIILFLSGQMYIRNFVPPVAKTTSDEQRFNGCDPDKLSAIYEECFPKDFSEKLLEMVPELENSSLNFSRLDNLSFHQKLPDTFRSFIDIAMLPFTDHLDEETSLALNGYVLRLHFDTILAKLAEVLLKKVLERDKRADLFLKYYNGDTVFNTRGQKVKKPSIIDANNNTWNFSAIFSILTQHKQAQKNLLTHKKALEEKEEIYLTLKNELDTIQAKQKSETKKLEKLKERIAHRRLEQKSLKLKSTTDSNDALKSELRQCSSELRRDENEYDVLNDVVNNINLRLENHKTETNNREQHVIKEKELMKKIETSFIELNKNYKLIKTALAKAITGR